MTETENIRQMIENIAYAIGNKPKTVIDDISFIIPMTRAITISSKMFHEAGFEADDIMACNTSEIVQFTLVTYLDNGWSVNAVEYSTSLSKEAFDMLHRKGGVPLAMYERFLASREGNK